MASWTMPPQRPDSLDRDASFFWHGMDPMPDDYQNDFLGEFVDFDAASQSFAPAALNQSQPHPAALNLAMPTMPDTSTFMDHHTESSSGFTTGDEFDLGSVSSQAGMTIGSNSHGEVDPQSLIMEPSQLDYLKRESVSDDSDMPKLDGMSLHSPIKARAVSPTTSPADEKAIGKGHKLVEALSSTIKKATTMRKGKKQQPVPDRSGSPTIGDMPSGKLPKQRKSSRTNGGAKGATSTAATSGDCFSSPPADLDMAEDPFIEPIHLPDHRYFVQGFERSLESPGVKSESGAYANDATVAHMSSDNWPLPNAPNSAPAQWNDPTVEYLRGQGAAGGAAGWWNIDLQQQQHIQQQSQQHLGQVNKHAQQINMVMHGQHGEIPYDYAAMQDPSAGGLMIQMPQQRQGSTVIITNDHNYDHRRQHSHHGGGIAISDQTYLPPPPPPPPHHQVPSNHNSPTHSPDRNTHRPPRAKSSGARHLSCSPVRKPRAGASSPGGGGGQSSSSGSGHGQQTPRHSSSGSVGSTRSASGRLPASMPGTPCSVRKRRSSANLAGASSTSPTKASHSRRTSSTAVAAGNNQRRPSLNNLRSASAAAMAPIPNVGIGLGGAGGGGLGGGFVNFTPSDGGVLMTGVAPSGSSKTKARREKEAMERRRKLSEAAMKAVRDAGGDVEKLLGEGFTF